MLSGDSARRSECKTAYYVVNVYSTLASRWEASGFTLSTQAARGRHGHATALAAAAAAAKAARLLPRARVNSDLEFYETALLFLERHVFWP